MSTAYLWVKAFHIVFVASWFAGLFYLPRIFVNLAMVPLESHAERERLLLMARKLYRFAHMLMGLALLLGLWLWLGFDVWRLVGGGNGWLHAKLLLVILLSGYHGWMVGYAKKLAKGERRLSGKALRLANEIPGLAAAVIVVLAVVKPF